jgi:tripartite-type tricarboxylate transporter receptor subunit TctC
MNDRQITPERNSLMTERFIATALCGSLILSAGAACAQSYPVKPVRIVTAEPGGGHDLAARMIAQGLTAGLGQQVIVENRSGAIFAGDVVAKAPPDGYTLLAFGSSLWLLPFMRSSVPYDAVRDFTPIILATDAPVLVVIHPSLPVKSVKDLIVLAKARPGDIDYASGASGASSHLAVELFKSMAGVNLVRIPYRGNGPALTAVISGQVQLIFPTAGSAAPHLKSNRLRALAVASAKPTSLMPGLPTVASAGLPGYESSSIVGVFAPAKTPAAIISRLNAEIQQALNKPETKQRFFDSGVETPGGTPEQLAAAVKSEMTVLGKLIRDVGIRVD